MSSESPAVPFSELGLSDTVVRAVKAIGYEAASPIQAATIPPMLEGEDILGQAQTGTGKTAAFALPILSRLDMKKRVPQALVLVPTRELAIQVSEAFQKYAAGQHAFHVLPIYGGQSYVPQLNALNQSGCLAQQILAAGFLSCHSRSEAISRPIAEESLLSRILPRIGFTSTLFPRAEHDDYTAATRRGQCCFAQRVHRTVCERHELIGV